MRSRDWCKLPYPSHPKGCPNYGKKETCPPKAPLFNNIVKPPFVLVGVKFDLLVWTKQMKKKHSDWSDRQLRCCLYWQGKVRKRLREECEKVVTESDVILYTPEANGVNVFETCKYVNIQLKRNPKVFVWKIAIIGKSKHVNGLGEFFS